MPTKATLTCVMLLTLQFFSYSKKGEFFFKMCIFRLFSHYCNRTVERGQKSWEKDMHKTTLVYILTQASVIVLWYRGHLKKLLILFVKVVEIWKSMKMALLALFRASPQHSVCTWAAFRPNKT